MNPLDRIAQLAERAAIDRATGQTQ